MKPFGQPIWRFCLAVGICLGAAVSVGGADSLPTGLAATPSHLLVSAVSTASTGEPLTVSQGVERNSLAGLAVKNEVGGTAGCRLGSPRCSDLPRPFGWHSLATEERS